MTARATNLVWSEVMPLWNALEDGRDVMFYAHMVLAGGRPAVELGVGYGRVAGRVGPDYGVDTDPQALARCAAAAPGSTLLRAGAEDYELPAPAQFSYAPQNLISLLPAGGLELMLATAYRNTRPGGWLAFDAAVPHWDRLRARYAGPVLRGQVGEARLWVRAEFAADLVLMHHSVERVDAAGLVCDRRDYEPVPVRFLPPELVRQALQDAGWRVAAVWGGFGGQPLTGASTRQVWLARRPEC